MVAAFLAIATISFLLFPYSNWKALSFQLEEENLNQIRACEVIDQKVNAFSEWKASGPRRPLQVRQYVAGENPSDHKLDSDYIPANRLFPRKVMNDAVVDAVEEKLGPLLREVLRRFYDPQGEVDFWIGNPAPDRYIVVVANHADYVPSFRSNPLIDQTDVLDPPEEDEYYAESMIMTYHDGKIDTATIFGFYPLYEAHGIHLRSPLQFTPSLGLPFSWIGDEIWMASPISESGEEGMLVYSDDNGATWEEEEGFPNVFSFARSPKGVLYMTQKGFEHTSAFGVNSEVTRIFKWNQKSRKWEQAEGPDHDSDAEVECCGFVADKPVFRVDRTIYTAGKTNRLKELLFSKEEK